MNRIEEVFSIALPVGETLAIKRNRYAPSDEVSGLPRISIVSGIHGDELEGQYVMFLLNEWLLANKDKIKGIIDLYPAINSLGIDTITREIPFYQVDINRVFPGSRDDFLPAQMADAVVDSISGSDIAIDIHSSNIFLREIPQVRISNAFAPVLLPLAKQLNIDFIWTHDAVTVLEATLAHTLNSRGTKTLVVEMGVGMRITKDYGRQLLSGLINLMARNGILNMEPPADIREPIYSDTGVVFYINANKSGIFVPESEHRQEIAAGDTVGRILNPLTGEIGEEIKAPGGGVLFTLREYPIVYEGSLIARIFGG